MNIQQSINTVLGQTAIAARLNPAFEKRAAAREAEQLSKKAGEYIDIEADRARPIKEQAESEMAADVEFAESAAQYAREAFRLDPSQENREVMMTLVEHAYEAKEIQQDELARRRQVAEEKAAESARMAAEHKRNQQAAREFTSIITGGGDIEEWKRKYGGEVQWVQP